MCPEDHAFSSLNIVNARSILYFWDVRSDVLEGNSKVEVITLSNWSDDDLEILRRIHKMSWGFFIPPRRKDHIVVLAYLSGSPVGMAYLNKNNF